MLRGAALTNLRLGLIVNKVKFNLPRRHEARRDCACLLERVAAEVNYTQVVAVCMILSTRSPSTIVQSIHLSYVTRY